MDKRALRFAAISIFALTVQAGCKNSPDKPEVVQAQTLEYGDPPRFNVGLSVEGAYEAIPHRRTVWKDTDSTASAPERAYLKTIFDVLDQATTVRVAGMREYAACHFEYSDPGSDYEKL